MTDKSKKGWYIAFGSILAAIGTFLVTTDPIFHYGDLLKSGKEIDTTKIVRDFSNKDLDSFKLDVPRVRTLSQIDREVQENKRKNCEQDSLIQKHEEILQ